MVDFDLFAFGDVNRFDFNVLVICYTGSKRIKERKKKNNEMNSGSSRTPNPKWFRSAIKQAQK